MLRISTIVLTIAACAMCGAPAVAQDSATLKKIKDSKTITLGVRDASIPFSYLDDKQQYVGYSIDLCMKIVDAVKAHLKMPDLKVATTRVSSQIRMQMMMSGAIDLECGSTTNSVERQKMVAFVVTTFFTGTKLLVKSSSNIKSFKDLKGKPVVVTTGTTNERALKDLSFQETLGIRFIQSKELNDAFLAVESGSAAAYPMDDVLLYSLRANAKHPAELAVVGDFLTDEPYGIMLRKDDPAFKKLADDAVIALFKSGDINKIYARWFQSPIPPKNVNLNMPMSSELKKRISNPNDKGVDKCGRMDCMMSLGRGL